MNISPNSFLYTGGNAIVVIAAAGVAAALENQGITDAISLTGDIKPGIPPFEPPKFEIQDGNNTISSSEIFTVSILAFV